MTKTRLRATRGLWYPDAKSLPIVLEAGGVSKLTDEQRKRVKFREVKAGEFCDDVPEESRAALMAKGAIEEVEAPSRAKKGG